MAKKPSKSLSIADLYPDFSSEEHAEAEANLKAYVALVWRIYTRLKAEGKLEEALLRIQYEKRNRNKR